jgi:Tat protein translocase TatB subunit
MDFFGIGPLELLLIFVVALLVLGPRQLPQLAYRLGSLLHQARAQISEVRERVLVDLTEERTHLEPGEAAEDTTPPPVSRRPTD